MSLKAKESRRNFLKKSGVLGLSAIVGSASSGCVSTKREEGEVLQYDKKQFFNMSGYAAQGLDLVRIAVIGLGDRGAGTVRRLASIEGVEIKALCDMEFGRVDKAAKSINHLGHNPDFYFGDENEWKKVCERLDIDLVVVVTPWHLHTPMCVFAMEHDKHTYVELPAALTIEECWQLIETSEKTRKHCVQMSTNSHHSLFAPLLNMARNDFFGDIIHGEGCYIHDLLMEYLLNKNMYHNMWRIKENIGKSGSLYPQHGLVPIMQFMDINYGDRMDYLVSVSTDDFTMGKTVEQLAFQDKYWEQYIGKNFRGNMNTTTIRTVKGRTIVIQHDVTSPRPRGGYLLSGTKAIFESHPNRIAIGNDKWLEQSELNELIVKYTPEITKKFNEFFNRAKQIVKKGHSYYRVDPTDWRVIDCLRNGLPMDMDVYEAVSSSSIIPLSIMSVSQRSKSIDIPDFTRGAWRNNQQGMDINLKLGGGTTKLL